MMYIVVNCFLPDKVLLPPTFLNVQHSRTKIKFSIVQYLPCVCFIEHDEGLTTHSCYAMWQIEKASY